jgi:hypothetical protein
MATLSSKIVITGFNLILGTAQATPGEFAYFNSSFAINA